MSTATSADVASVIATSRYVLLDFDGPICSIFAGLHAPVIADELRRVLTRHRVAIPDEIAAQGDPLEVLRFAGTIDGNVALDIEQTLRAAELQAADSAAPTPGAHEFLSACRTTGRPVAVVSNNSPQAVARYLDRANLVGLVQHIEGRDPSDPALMKPNPALLHRALSALHGAPASTVLIGDSRSDFEAAHTAGTQAIAYANKPGKAQALTTAGATAVVDSMAQLALVTAHTFSR